MDDAVIAGFTGPQAGMNDRQASCLAVFFTQRLASPAGLASRTCWLHHGDCQGSDERAHGIAKNLGWLIGLHPPLNPTMRAFCKGADRVYPPLDYIPRNHAMVDEIQELFATPDGEERLRSGTWSTIRYARKRLKMVTIIYPDGSLEFNP